MAKNRPETEPKIGWRQLLEEDRRMLDQHQRDTFKYFLHEINPQNGLVRDTTRKGSHASITATGLGLAAYVVAAKRGFISREEAASKTVTVLRFFAESKHDQDADASGYKGFYYHFLEMETGKRAWKSELSTIDTTFLLAGMLTAALYFDHAAPLEREIRSLAEALYRRVDWQWALNEGAALTHGWKPESGFLKYRWEGYNEALLLYILGLGSPTSPLPEQSYRAWTRSYRWKKIYGFNYLYGGPLFIHQLSHAWVDFRGIQDHVMHARGLDYFENSRRATYVQRQYAIRNPKKYSGYNENCWGITASDGPGPQACRIDGIPRRFYAYRARGVPFGPDDGTIAPWAVMASLPFAPEIVVPALHHFNQYYPEMISKYGYRCSFNPTYPAQGNKSSGWISEGYFGLDQGPILMMIENFRSGFVWDLMRKSAYVVNGLRRAGFSGGWLAGD